MASCIKPIMRERERERERGERERGGERESGNYVLHEGSQKEITSQTDLYIVILSSKRYVFEDKMTKYLSV